MNGNATKHIIEGLSLWRWCIKHNRTLNQYKFYLWLIKNKCMTPEQAVQWKHIPPEQDQHARRLRATRRFLGWSEEEIALNLTVEEAKLKGRRKKATVLYGGRTLGEIANEVGMSRGCLWYRVNKMGMSVKEATSYKSIRETILKYKGKSVYELFDARMARRIIDRVAHGWGLEQAVITPIDPNWRHRPVSEWQKKKLWKLIEKSY